MKNKELVEVRPSFHITAPVGWLNDPNGFSVYQGEYHLFYQYHPYSTKWGPMHWGHCKTEDFIQWEQLPIALTPDKTYDAAGCFSGSALEYDGNQVLAYTGVSENQQQTQCIAVGNGVDYEKWSINPVVTAGMTGEEISENDFRDPKIWKYNERFYMVVACCDNEKKGRVALFSSEDLKAWDYQGMLAKNNGNYGKMWECPDFFELNGTHILLISPQDLKARGLEIHNGDGTLYFTGTFDYNSCEFQHGEAKQIDYGFDFYAPQTTVAEDGRRIMIAWMQSWDSYLTPEKQSWSGMMTIPRELTYLEGKLFQQPVRELEKYYKNEVSYSHIKLNGQMELEGISGREINLELEVFDGAYDKIEIQLAKSQEYETICRYEPDSGIFTFDRTYSGIYRDVICIRKIKVTDGGQNIKIRILLDKHSVEVFINNGEQAVTSILCTPLQAQKVGFFVQGEIEASIVKQDIVVGEK